MAKVLTIGGVRYRVLPLTAAKHGPRYLLRNDDGDLFGLYAQNAAPTRLVALPLVIDREEPSALERVDFFEAEGGLIARTER